MYERLVFNLDCATVRKENLDGREHYVVPAAILQEGVWEGSEGPLFYPEAEIKNSVPSWNHKPLVVYHPEKTACDPVVLNTRGVGIILNTKYDQKLRTECWIDVEKAQRVDRRIIDLIENKSPVEVSTGLYTDRNDSPGEFNGKKYDAVVSNYRPDHLAVLPDKLGAYSVKDGGGMMVINQGREPELVQVCCARSAAESLKSVGASFVNNELTFDDIPRQLTELLAAKYGTPGKYWEGYVREVYPSKVVFQMDYGSRQPYMIGYSKNGDAVTLNGEAVPVKRVVQYRPSDGPALTSNEDGDLSITEETTMADKFDRKAHIDGLVGTTFNESARPVLESMTDDQLAKLIPAQTKPEEKPTQNASPPDPFQSEELQELRSYYQAERGRLVDEIVANEKNPFSKDFLSKKPLQELRGLASLARKETPVTVNVSPSMFRPDYSGAIGAAPVMNAETEVLPMPTMSLKSN